MRSTTTRKVEPVRWGIEVDGRTIVTSPAGGLSDQGVATLVRLIREARPEARVREFRMVREVQR